METYCPKSRKDWRKWLEKNHQSKQGVWLVYYKTSTKIPSLTWSEAVDEALCYGWIDSTKKTIDDERYMQYFSKRNPNSTWSKINKEKVSRLIDNNLMTQAGFESIKTAKENGRWDTMHDIEELIIPEDLKIELNKDISSMEFFQSQSRSIKIAMLHWVVTAKRMETRKKRIDEIALLAAKGLRPKQFG
ncbi:MAG: YdeI/OmpD-associated family protein [Sporocytophaga sp.]|nr:YdeI/OmpD-associated family protein [Sporocytophaga sp.]